MNLMSKVGAFLAPFVISPLDPRFSSQKWGSHSVSYLDLVLSVVKLSEKVCSKNFKFKPNVIDEIRSMLSSGNRKLESKYAMLRG